MPAHARVQVLQNGGRDPGGLEARASDPQAPVQIWARLVEPLVVEETVGCGARMTSDSTSTRQPRLVPLMHQIRQMTRWACFVAAGAHAAPGTASSRPWHTSVVKAVSPQARRSCRFRRKRQMAAVPHRRSCAHGCLARRKLGQGIQMPHPRLCEVP